MTVMSLLVTNVNLRRVVGPFGTPRGTKMTRVTHAVLVTTLLTVPVLVERAYAHHGAGLYDVRKNVELEGKLTRVDFVNPHTYIYSMSSVPTARSSR